MSETSSKPTIVLVHGSFADASGWAGVIRRLLERGFPVAAPPNPLRGIAQDAAYLRSYLDTVSGPVILAAHSYGGAVISNAAMGNGNVRALVYINGFALDEGESVLAAGGLGGATGELGNHLIIRPFPDAGEGNGDGYIDPEHFHRLFCADLSADDAAVLAASQRPGALASLGEPSGPPAWRSIPTWYLASTGDKTIPVEAERVMGQRTGGAFAEIDSSHVAMISHPDEVTDLILQAVAATEGTESVTSAL
jgi:pimeloyl-ACP methyl ester carboxylesterase